MNLKIFIHVHVHVHVHGYLSKPPQTNHVSVKFP